jgi:hypothetical protein
MAWTQEKVNEIYAKVQQLATTDEEFRTELLKDSSVAIAKVAGEELPADFKVKVVENDPQYAATFVLPPMASEELDDTDLDKVAGGMCLVDGCAAEACAADACIADGK